MANPSKRIGTQGENRVLEILRDVGFHPERTSAGKAGHDITIGTGLPVEVKRQKNLLVPAWTRYLQKLHGDEWALFVLPRDRRSKDAFPELMVVPAKFGAQLLADHS